MPSIENIEHFKQHVQSLAKENEIRQAQGLRPEEITPPETKPQASIPQPTSETPKSELESFLADQFVDKQEDFEPSQEEDLLAGLFDDPIVPQAPIDFPQENTVVDETLENTTGENDFASAPGIDFSRDEGLETKNQEDDPLTATSDLEATFDENSWDAQQETDFATPSVPQDEALSQPFTQDELAMDGKETKSEEEWIFDDEVSSQIDFPELAEFSSTQQKDVEDFDTTSEVDEFQLGDFESQFGIVSDGQHGLDLLNPAQAIEGASQDIPKIISLTEEEFLTLQATLSRQPLNLKLILEELISGHEASVEDLDKLIKLLIIGAKTKTIASVAGKILGKKIPIPSRYEKGSGEDVEKKITSVWFNIQTITTPILRLSLLVSLAVALVIILSWNFVIKPLKANEFYNQGLEEIKQNNGDLAEDLFAQAYYYWPARDRFFQYAEAYMDSGDYNRTRDKYLELLRPSIKPFSDSDKNNLDAQFEAALAPLPPSLDETTLKNTLLQRKVAVKTYYRIIKDLLSLSSGEIEQNTENDIKGSVVFHNEDKEALLALSLFETYYGADGYDLDTHFQRADNVLAPLIVAYKTPKDALLRKGDNFLEWAKALSSRQRLEEANSAFSTYMQWYGNDAHITWRFVKLFLLLDDEKELLALKHRLQKNIHMTMDGEVMAQLAGWLLDKETSREEREKKPVHRHKTFEEEYGIRSIQSQNAVKTTTHEKEKPSLESSSLARAAGAASQGNSSGQEAGHGEASKTTIDITPPYKYPYSSQPFRPSYLEELEELLLRCLNDFKNLPELHYQLSRYYRHFKQEQEEKKALAATDTYFQLMETRKLRLNERPTLRVATLNRIGEIFLSQEQPLQAERYFLDAQRHLETALVRGLIKHHSSLARVYVNLGDLYYEQAPGSEKTSLIMGSWDQALELYKKAQSYQADLPKITYRKAVIAYEKREFSQVIWELFQLEKQPELRNYANLLYAMGNALFRSHNYHEAQGYYLLLYDILQKKRATIKDFDVVRQNSHRYLAKYMLVVSNNLAAAAYRGSTSVRASSKKYKESLRYLTAAQAMAVVLGQDIFSSRKEFDITDATETHIQAIEEETRSIIAKTRREQGLIEANLQVLALAETTSATQRANLMHEIDIFSRIPLDLEQEDSL